MGGAISQGVDNDDLITKLCETDYIQSPKVEFAFRAVDRALYYPAGHERLAYQDLAYKNGDIHLSAPCIYCEVIKALELKEGLSFLNIGSGTGYLSTLAGLLLGPHGTNHGVEICENVVKFARVKLQEFLHNAMPNILGVEFCEPEFVVGDGLCINPCYRQYDRVYCGAAVDGKYESYMRSLIKVGGILVMPFDDSLIKVCKVNETVFECSICLPVSFSPMMENAMRVNNLLEESKAAIEIASTPLALQALCRICIRRTLGPKHLKNVKKLKLLLPQPAIEYLLYK